jgi:hypothetical protein
VAQVRTDSNGSVDAIARAVSLIRDAGVPLKLGEGGRGWNLGGSAR